MFLFNYRGVVLALVLVAFFSYLAISGRLNAAEPWISGVMLTFMALLFVRTWFG